MPLVANGQLAEADAELTRAVATIRGAYGRASRNAVVAFSAWMNAVSRLDPARAALLIEEERQVLENGRSGLPASSDLQLRGQQIANAWLAGNTAASAAVSLPDEAQLMAPSTLRDNEFLLIHHARALVAIGAGCGRGCAGWRGCRRDGQTVMHPPRHGCGSRRRWPRCNWRRVRRQPPQRQPVR